MAPPIEKGGLVRGAARIDTSVPEPAEPVVQRLEDAPAERPALLLRPPVQQPLQAAFGDTPARAKALPVWTGPRIGLDELHEAREQALLQGAGTSVAIAALEPFDASRPPVVLVHGIAGAPDDLRDVAQRLRAAGRQVLVAFYDDKGTRTSDNGAALASALRILREQYYPPGASMDIVAHSMGGIVTRCALNTLQDPRWLDEGSTHAAAPRAGFGAVRVHTLDTPWEGGGGPDLPPVIREVVHFFMRLFGWSGLFDMMSHSAMFEHLYDAELAGVRFQNHAAHEEGKPDGIRSLPDMDEDELRLLAGFVASGTLPASGRLRNAARGLAQDSRFPDLRARFLAQRPDCDDPAALLVRTYEQVMPRFSGTHETVLQDRPAETDLVDHLVRELAVF